jgi:hypothetical protein
VRRQTGVIRKEGISFTPHPHPNPPLEGEGEFLQGIETVRKIRYRNAVPTRHEECKPSGWNTENVKINSTRKAPAMSAGAFLVSENV